MSVFGSPPDPGSSIEIRVAWLEDQLASVLILIGQNAEADAAAIAAVAEQRASGDVAGADALQAEITARISSVAGALSQLAAEIGAREQGDQINLGQINQLAQQLDQALGESVAVASWTDLLDVPRENLPRAKAAKVYGPDAGTHVDPVLGGAPVANTGIYSHVPGIGNGTGWKRIANLEVADIAAAIAAVTVALDAKVTAANDAAAAAVAARDTVLAKLVDDSGQQVYWSVGDTLGTSIFHILRDGTVVNSYIQQIAGSAAAALAAAGAIVNDTAQVALWSASDSNGNALLAIMNDAMKTPRNPWLDQLRLDATAAQTTADKITGDHWLDLRPTAQIEHDVYLGQSNSIGVGGYAITTTARTDALMFATGVAQQHAVSTDPAVLYVSLTNLLAGQYPTATYDYEDPVVGIAQLYAQRMLAEKGVATTTLNQKILFTEPGQEGQAIVAMQRGQPLFTRATLGMTYARSVAQAGGKSHSVGMLGFDQGEADDRTATFDYYYGQLLQLRADTEAFARTLMNRPGFRLPMALVQTSSYLVSAATNPAIVNPYPWVALAQLAAAEAHPMIALACPSYQFDYSGLHLDAASHKWKGGYFGSARFDWKMLGRKPRHLKPVSCRRDGKFIELLYNPPSGRLAFDTVWVTDPGNKGFSVQSLDHATDVAIASVELVGTCGVGITLAADPGVSVEVQYAFRGGNVHGGRAAGARGCLRDTTGDTLVMDLSVGVGATDIAGAPINWGTAGPTRAMHVWAPLHRFITN